MTSNEMFLRTRRTRPVLLPVAVLAVVLTALLSGCGAARPGSDGPLTTASPSTATASPTSTATSAPTRATTATAAPTGAGIPDGFPLAQGLTGDGDTTVTGPQRGVKGIDLQPRCWGGAWPGAALDRLVVQQVGPELAVTRELAVYRDAATAAAVAEQVQVRAEHCRRLPATPGQAATDVTMHGAADVSRDSGTMAFSETIATGEPGGAVFVFTPVGRAVLAVEDGGEWTQDSAGQGARQLERADRGLVARLCVFSKAGC